MGVRILEGCEARAELPESVARYFDEAVASAQEELQNAVGIAVSRRPPSPLLLAIRRADRANDGETAMRLLEQADHDARSRRPKEQGSASISTGA